MEEVERQLKPFRDSLDKNTRETEGISRWKLALWSNGSGGPPGYLEIARAQDKDWKDALIKKVDALTDAQTLRAGEEIWHSKWFKKWATIATITIALLALVLGVFTFFEGRRVATGELKISNQVNPAVVSSSQPSSQSASDPSLR